MTAQEARVRALTPTVADVSGRARAYPDKNILATIEPRSVATRRWHGYSIVRVHYARGGGGQPIVPGLVAMPADGEYYASPALVRLAASDPTVGALFSGQRRVGIIAEDGLVKPNELRAVVGISHESHFLVQVRGFGGRIPLGVDGNDKSRLTRVVGLVTLVVVWVTALAYLLMITRLAQRHRQQSARALRLLGMSRFQIRTIQGASAFVLAMFGAAIGSATFLLCSQRLTRIPGTEFGFFESDLGVTGTRIASVTLMVALLAAVLTAAAVQMPEGDAAAKISKAPVRPAKFGLVLLFGGLAFLGTLRVFALFASPSDLPGPAAAVAALGLWASSGAVAAGFALAAPSLVSRWFQRLAVRVHDAGTLVGLRAHRDASAASLRLGALTGVIVIVLLGLVAFSSVLNGGTSKDWRSQLAGTPYVPLVVNDFSDGLTLADVRGATPLGAALQVRSDSRGDVSVVFGDCRDMDVLTGKPTERCTGDIQRIAVGESVAAEWPEGKSITVPGVGKIPPPSTTAVASNSRLPQALHGAVLVPSRLAGPRAVDGRGGAVYYVLVPGRSLDISLARLSGVSPTVQFDLGALASSSPDDKPFPSHVEWLALCVVLTLGIGVMSVATMTAAEGGQRAGALRAMVLLGAPPRQVLKAHVVITGLPVLCIGIAALITGGAVAGAMYAIDDRAYVGWSTYAALLGGIAVVAVVVPFTTRHTVAESTP